MLAETQTAAFQLPFALEMMGVIVGSMCGALGACERKLDVVGGISLGMVCGLGGGLIRDVIMQCGSVYMLDSAYGIPVSVATAAIVFFFHGPFKRRPETIEWLDIFAIALFAVAGADKALIYGESFFAAILMGVLTGNGGGLLRDIVLGDVPHLFEKDRWYGICAFFGSVAYVALVTGAGIDKNVAGCLATLLIVVSRRAALRYNLQSPANIDLTPKVKQAARRIRGRGNRDGGGSRA